MRLVNVKRNKKGITVFRQFNHTDDETNDDKGEILNIKELPSDDFDKVWNDLITPVIEVLGLQKKGWHEGIVITGFALRYTKQETASMTISFDKVLDNLGGKVFKMKTPVFRIDKPADGENGDLEVEKETAEICHRAIEEANEYADGKRSQKTFAEFAEENGALAKVAADEPDNVLPL